MRLKFVLALTAVMAACSSALAGDDQSKPTEKMPIIQSNEQTVQIRGISRSDTPFGNSLIGGTYTEWFILSFLDKHAHVARHLLYVKATYTPGHWGGDFQKAYTDDGEVLSIALNEMRSGACNGDDCAHLTTLGVDLPEALLRDRTSDGFQVKFVARGGANGFAEQLSLWVSPEMIQKQLTALAEAEKLP
jgi:hypothetical protein